MNIKEGREKRQNNNFCENLVYDRALKNINSYIYVYIYIWIYIYKIKEGTSCKDPKFQFDAHVGWDVNPILLEPTSYNVLTFASLQKHISLK